MFDAAGAVIIHSFSNVAADSMNNDASREKSMLDSTADRNSTSDVLLSAAKVVDGELEITWQSGGAPARFSPFWLRDHCHSKESLNPDTLQRQVDTFAIPVDIAPATVEIGAGGRTLRVAWKHGGTSILPAAFLWNIAQSNGRDRAPQRRLWDRAPWERTFRR